LLIRTERQTTEAQGTKTHITSAIVAKFLGALVLASSAFLGYRFFAAEAMRHSPGTVSSSQRQNNTATMEASGITIWQSLHSFRLNFGCFKYYLLHGPSVLCSALQRKAEVERSKMQP